MEDVTDSDLVFDLRAKLDSQGFYDDNEVNRAVNVVDPRSTQKDLVAAIAPVAERLLLRCKDFQKAIKAARAIEDHKAEKDALDEKNALELFKRNMGAFKRVYSFLSQIFNYENTDIEKRSIFYRRLLPPLEFGRERDEVALSGVVLTHHDLKNKGKRDLPVGLATPTS